MHDRRMTVLNRINKGSAADGYHGLRFLHSLPLLYALTLGLLFPEGPGRSNGLLRSLSGHHRSFSSHRSSYDVYAYVSAGLGMQLRTELHTRRSRRQVLSDICFPSPL